MDVHFTLASVYVDIVTCKRLHRMSCPAISTAPYFTLEREYAYLHSTACILTCTIYLLYLPLTIPTYVRLRVYKVIIRAYILYLSFRTLSKLRFGLRCTALSISLCNLANCSLVPSVDMVYLLGARTASSLSNDA